MCFARGRWTGRPLTAALAAIVLYNVLVLFGYLLSFSEMLPHFGLKPGFAMFMGALTLAYMGAAAVVLVVHQALIVVRRHLDARLNPGRRRALSAAGNLLMAAPFAAMGY